MLNSCLEHAQSIAAQSNFTISPLTDVRPVLICSTSIKEEGKRRNHAKGNIGLTEEQRAGVTNC